MAGALLAVAFFIPDAGVGLIEELPLYGLFTLATCLAAPGTRSVEIRSDGNSQAFSWAVLWWHLFSASPCRGVFRFLGSGFSHFAST